MARSIERMSKFGIEGDFTMALPLGINAMLAHPTGTTQMVLRRMVTEMVQRKMVSEQVRVQRWDPSLISKELEEHPSSQTLEPYNAC